MRCRLYSKQKSSNTCLVILRQLFVTTEAPVGGSCATVASDSCSDSNAGCVGGTCECNDGYYDSDGVSDNNAGTCTLRKSQNFDPQRIQTTGNLFARPETEKPQCDLYSVCRSVHPWSFNKKHNNTVYKNLS